jgi:transposase-like protein
MSRNEYDTETKAAVLAALLDGQAVSAVVDKWNIPEGTIKAWKSRLANPNPVATQKKEQIGNLLVDYLTANLETLRIQAEETFRDPEWLKQQNAADVAVLHGVIADKTVRLLEALAPGGAE